MKKKAYSVYLRGPVRAFVERRIRDEKHPYKGFSEYCEAAIFYDMLAGLPHALLADLMGRPEWSREKLMNELSEQAASGDLPKGWIEDRIRKMLKDPPEKPS
jgi:hypothetical protein